MELRTELLLAQEALRGADFPVLVLISGADGARRLTARKLTRIVGWVVAGLAMACVVALVFGLLVVWLWGVTLTPLFHIPQPSYWQAVGLIILGKLLFGGFGHPHGGPSHSSRQRKWHDRFEGRRPGCPPFFHQDRENDDYHEFWETEGRQAFEAFLERRRTARDEAGGS